MSNTEYYVAVGTQKKGPFSLSDFEKWTNLKFFKHFLLR
jgi:hypothetical protein